MPTKVRILHSPKTYKKANLFFPIVSFIKARNLRIRNGTFLFLCQGASLDNRVRGAGMRREREGGGGRSGHGCPRLEPRILHSPKNNKSKSLFPDRGFYKKPNSAALSYISASYLPSPVSSMLISSITEPHSPHLYGGFSSLYLT